MIMPLITNPINATSAHQNDVVSICKEFLNKHNISFFSYLFCHNDGSCHILSTHPELYQYLFKHEFALTPKIQSDLLTKTKIYLNVPEQGNYESVMDNVAIQFRLYNPFDIIIRSENFYEMFCYGINYYDNTKANYYLNNLAELENFALMFKEKASAIIKKLKMAPVILSNNMLESIKDLFITCQPVEEIIIKPRNQNKYPLAIKNKIISITSREYICLKNLLNGKTAKETAQEMNISYRTVESYLENIKEKTHSRNKIDLVSKIKDLSLFTD
jgi:DNA-binding CsgD family transcriptional regulator